MAKVFKISVLSIGGGKFCPLRKDFCLMRTNLLNHSGLIVILFISIVLPSLFVGCTSETPPLDPPPLMTRADSVAAGLISAVPTADGDWCDTLSYDFNGNPIEGLAVGGTDTDISNGGTVWGE